MQKGSCLIGQSGGPTAVINTTLLGIIEEAYRLDAFERVMGSINGIDGVIKENFVDFKDYSKEELQLLKTTPSAAIGSVRFHLSDDFNDEIYAKIANVFKKYNICCFFYIGGNDSMDTCCKLDKYFKSIKYPCNVIGIPKTIDNDMVIIDHTPGFASAAKFIATSISEIYNDLQCYSHGRVTFIEIMGRDSGWLTASAKVASHMGCGADLIYVPEHPFDLNSFLERVQTIYDKNKKVIVAVSEGIKDNDGNYFLQKRLYNQNDDFGHLQLGGVGMVLAEIVNKELHLPVRSVELNILQRCASHILSKTDITEAYKCGVYGVRFALKGKTGVMVAMKRVSNNPYRIKYCDVPLEKIANYVKELPPCYINEEGNNINDNYLEYILPLIKGEVKVPLKNGVCQYFKLKK